MVRLSYKAIKSTHISEELLVFIRLKRVRFEINLTALSVKFDLNLNSNIIYIEKLLKIKNQVHCDDGELFHI